MSAGMVAGMTATSPVGKGLQEAPIHVQIGRLEKLSVVLTEQVAELGGHLSTIRNNCSMPDSAAPCAPGAASGSSTVWSALTATGDKLDHVSDMIRALNDSLEI